MRKDKNSKIDLFQHYRSINNNNIEHQTIQMSEDVDNLQQKLISTRYSVIDGMRSVNTSLQKQQNMKSKNKEKLNEMKRKLTQLQMLDRKVNKQAFNYQYKLDKLEGSQDYAILLTQLKQVEIEKREKDLKQKQRHCKQTKDKQKQRRQMSLSIFENVKKERVKKIREENFHSYLECKKRMEEEEDRRRKSSQNIKQKLFIARDRKRRYEQFKLQQAQYNYDIKRENEASKYKDKAQYLKDLREKEKEEEQIFRKTQILNRQTSRIESIYLTSQG